MNVCKVAIVLLVLLATMLFVQLSIVTVKASYSGTNYEPLSAFQGDTRDFYYYASTDNSVTFKGNPSIRIAADPGNLPQGSCPYPDPGTREVDGASIFPLPRDRIVWSMWIKIGSANAVSGGRIGIDLYARNYGYPNNGVSSVTIVDGLPSSGMNLVCGFSGTPSNGPSPAITWTSTIGKCTGYNAEFIPWGTSGWVQMTYDFIVPTVTYATNAWGNSIPATQIDQAIPWFDARPATQSAYVWFANPTLYIISPSDPNYNQPISFFISPLSTPTPTSISTSTPYPTSTSTVNNLNNFLLLVFVFVFVMAITITMYMYIIMKRGIGGKKRRGSRRR